MQFSFEGTMEDFKGWLSMMRGIDFIPTVGKGPAIVIGNDDKAAAQEESKDSVGTQMPEKVELKTAPENEPKMTAQPKQVDQCIDPSTGTYYTAFADMAKALDALVDAGRQDDVAAILKVISVNGEYGGVPCGKWGNVEKNAKELLKKGSPKKAASAEAVTHDTIKALATTFLKKDKKNAPVFKELLANYGVVRVPDIAEDRCAEFYAKLKELAGGAA